jgi:Ca-activated chloride channel family protein
VSVLGLARPWVAGMVLGASLLPELALPPWVDRLWASPQMRTAQGLEAFEAGNYEAAVEPLNKALAAAPEDPLRQFNAGTAELANDDADAALSLLESAARALPEAAAAPDLAADALYNLGNARLAASDVAGAVEAYKQALRTLPDHADAKLNLELALRRLDEERQARDSQASPNAQEQGDQESSEQGEGQDQPGQNPNPDPSAQPDPGQGGNPQSNGESEQPPQQPPSRLPQFEEQPGMTAEQAAAILEAIENLEREARRAEAAARAAERPAGERDW